MQPQQRMTRRHTLVLALLGAVIVFLLVRRRVLTEDSILFFAVLLPSVILHEVSHGALALYFGDDTAKRAGRLTLNPVPHIDPLGTIILPAILILTTGTAFGWAKPVPVNTAQLRSPRNQSVLVSLVGPGVNIAIALMVALVVRLVTVEGTTAQFLFAVGFANVILAAFNLIPIPPLDGSAMIERAIPTRLWPQYMRVREYSMLVLIGLVLLLPGVFNRVFEVALGLWERLLV